jgi:hypothetical protein
VKTDWGGEYMIDYRKIDGNILKLILIGEEGYVTEVASYIGRGRMTRRLVDRIMYVDV